MTEVLCRGGRNSVNLISITKASHVTLNNTISETEQMLGEPGH